MRTLHFGLRVSGSPISIGRSRSHAAVGYGVAGSVPETGIGHLTVLKPAGDFPPGRSPLPHAKS